MNVTGTFPEGIITEDGRICREYVLEEQLFRHTLEIAHDKDIEQEAVNDQVYYSACLLSKRFTIAGIQKVTPAMILNLSAQDGVELANATFTLENQRSNFRSAAQAAEKERAGAPQVGAEQG